MGLAPVPFIFPWKHYLIATLSCRKYIMRHMKWTISRRYTTYGEALAVFHTQKVPIFISFFRRLRAALKCLESSAQTGRDTTHTQWRCALIWLGLSLCLCLSTPRRQAHEPKFYYLVSRYCVSRALAAFTRDRWRMLPKTETPKVNNNLSALTAQTTHKNHGDRHCQCIVVRATVTFSFVRFTFNRRANDELLHFSLGYFNCPPPQYNFNWSDGIVRHAGMASGK